jgi:hypothetical protein
MFFDPFPLLGLGAKPRRNFFMKSEAPTELPVVVGRAYDFSLWLIHKSDFAVLRERVSRSAGSDGEPAVIALPRALAFLTPNAVR